MYCSRRAKDAKRSLKAELVGRCQLCDPRPALSRATIERVPSDRAVRASMVPPSERQFAMKAARPVLRLGLLAVFSAALSAQAPTVAPRIWDDAALADGATPVATLNLVQPTIRRPSTTASPGTTCEPTLSIIRTTSPLGYWEELQTKTPEQLVDVSRIRSTEDWAAAGERAFREVDNFWTRTTPHLDRRAAACAVPVRR